MATYAAEGGPSFTTKEIEDFKEVFLAYDRFHTGNIRVKELRKLFKACGQNVSDAELFHISNHFYTDGKKTISFPDFMKVMEGRARKSCHEEDLREAFTVFDKERTGRFDALQFQHVLESIRVTEKLEQDEIEKFMKEIDVNKDGNIDYEELLSIIKH
ncbi:uncharacterized protein [Ptychodera flava]|uniref:uncharacterized protein n=1 Tax=Ptychodera flava TaxID=63121 RepID=UPI00396A6DA0